MAGLYIHIPFCKSRCVYCGFYSSTLSQLRQRYVDALCKEMELRSNYLNEYARTIYIGGGTPSQLTSMQFRQIFSQLKRVFYHNAVFAPDEVTVECNPDDVNDELAQSLAELGVYRVSMGVQTFSEQRLRFLRRRHTAAQIPAAIDCLRRAGINNISIDLMYGFPKETLDDWNNDIDHALSLGVQHLSAYSLMYEEGTPLYAMLEKGEVEEIDEEVSLQMYATLIDRLVQAGYEHYEISNFALKGMNGNEYRSIHNSNYWRQVPYLGLGAAAHSYDGNCREWNIDDVQQYIIGIEQGQRLAEKEMLDDDTRYNELVMTRLRTSEGLSLALLSDAQRSYMLSQAERFLTGGLLKMAHNHVVLTRRGLFVSNMVMSGLMIV